MAQFLVPQRAAVVMRECTLEETLPAGHLARFVWDVLKSFDFSEIEALYRSIHAGAGRPPYHPRMLAALWIYGMTQGVETAAGIAEACTNRDDFRWLAGGLCPCHQTLLNFLSATKGPVRSLWEQVLKAMHEAGHIDLSVLAEDGTKLRANASRRSFHTSDEIDAVIERLRAKMAQKVEEVVAPDDQRQHTAEVRALTDRLDRAERAAEELRARKEKRSGTGDVGKPSPEGRSSGPQEETAGKKFSRADFRHDPEKDVLICPGEQELRFVGLYENDNGRGTYRLYKRTNCSGCPLKSQCTDSKGRRLKIFGDNNTPESSAPSPETESQGSAEGTPAAELLPSKDAGSKRTESGPHASLTDPEARLMLATSEKRFEPSYNADITVTRDGVIVSQFLSTDPVDFAFFPRALPNVLSTLGRPDAWVGDGQYGTQANLELAERENVTLFAPVQGSQKKEDGKFTASDFRYEAGRDVLVCPAGNDLRKVGTYEHKEGRPYDLFARKNCGDCDLRSRCTGGRGRRVKRHHRHRLVEALEGRMRESGTEVSRFRGSTVEPVNGQLKQHGLGRFHVRGLARCGTALAFACIAHNVMKWKSREAARAINLN